MVDSGYGEMKIVGVYFLENHMNKVELSLFIEANYPATATSIAQRKPLLGIGANDAHYMTTPKANGARLLDPAYRAWVNMMSRAYDPKFHAVNQTYVGVTVCSEWHYFSAFRQWWLDNYRDDGQLDKDLLVVGNKEYGPDVCIYIPSMLNSFTTDCGASRGELPIGVSFCKQTGKYRSNCNNPITGKKRNLGRFNTPEEAHEAWLKCKLSLAEQLKTDMDAIDLRIYNNAVSIIKAVI